MTNTKSARIEWIYVAKMFGLLLVTLGHGGLTTPVIRDFIYSFHMPLFFILSGILYKERTATENLTLQLKRIIVPYLLINAIILMYYIAYLAVFGDFDIDFVYKSIVSVLLGLGYNVNDYKPLSTPTWFFVVLFFSHMLMSICKTNRLRVVAMIVCLVSYKWLSIMNIDTFIPFDSTMIAFPFVVMGYYAKRLITPPQQLASHLFSQPWGLPLMLVLLIIGHIINGRIDINTCNTGNSLILMYMNGVLGTLVIMRLSMHFVSCTSIAAVIASGGMLIVGFNLLAINYAKKAWALLTAYPIDEIVGLMLSIIITVVFYAVILFCRRHFKIIVGYR